MDIIPTIAGSAMRPDEENGRGMYKSASAALDSMLVHQLFPFPLLFSVQIDFDLSFLES
jgi:hypothetical protein